MSCRDTLIASENWGPRQLRGVLRRHRGCAATCVNVRKWPTGLAGGAVGNGRFRDGVLCNGADTGIALFARVLDKLAQCKQNKEEEEEEKGKPVSKEEQGDSAGHGIPLVT